MSEASAEPFKQLGSKLKTLRQHINETVAQVSSAVEIEEKVLSDIEKGSQRPSKDILELLISHFEMKDDEAGSLWKLAGYEPQPKREHHLPPNHGGQATILVMAVDPRIIYSDGVRISADNKGVVLNFLQNNDTAQGLTTSRIGMSRTQAEQLLIALQHGLQSTERKNLPPSIGEQR